MKNKSFTLIELLVVISVIGLLSSIVLVSTKGIREKARIAKTLEFSQSLQNALGSEAVAIWNFDENSGTVAKDSSGYGNNGTLYSGAAICANPPTAGCPTWTDDTPQKIIGQGSGKYALSFDGVDDYVDAGNAASLRPDAISVEAWVKYVSGSFAPVVSWNWIYQGFYLKYTGGLTKPIIILNSANYMYFQEGNLWDGNWHHIVFVVTGQGQTDIGDANFYIDGVSMANAGGSSANLPLTRSTLYIGRSGNTFFNGLIDDVRIYSKALTLGEIQQHYAEGLENHQLVKR